MFLQLLSTSNNQFVYQISNKPIKQLWADLKTIKHNLGLDKHHQPHVLNIRQFKCNTFELLNARDFKASVANREKTLYYKKIINFRGEHIFHEEMKSYVMSVKEGTLPADGSLGVVHPFLILQGKLSSAEITVMDTKNIRRRIILGTTQSLKSHYISVAFDSVGWVSVVVDLRSFVIPLGTNYLCLEQIHLKNAIIRRIFTVEQQYEQYLNFPHNLQHTIQRFSYIQEIKKTQEQIEEKMVKAPIIQQRPQSQQTIRQKLNNKENQSIEKQIPEEQKLVRKQLLKEQKLKLQAQHKAEAEHIKLQEEQKQLKLQQLKQIDERCRSQLKKQKQEQLLCTYISENQEYSNTSLDALADIIDIIETKMESQITDDKPEIQQQAVELQNPFGKSIITRKGNQTIVIDRRLY